MFYTRYSSWTIIFVSIKIAQKDWKGDFQRNIQLVWRNDLPGFQYISLLVEVGFFSTINNLSYRVDELMEMEDVRFGSDLIIIFGDDVSWR